jgi:hypothetical protein
VMYWGSPWWIQYPPWHIWDWMEKKHFPVFIEDVNEAINK